MAQTELTKPEYANPAQALSYLKKAADSGYRTSQVYALLGLAYSQVGEKQNAMNSLEQALALDPERNDARALLNQLKGGS
jgi:Flp pilus assembly protein TadD